MTLEGHYHKGGYTSMRPHRTEDTQGRLNSPWEEEISHPLSWASQQGRVENVPSPGGDDKSGMLRLSGSLGGVRLWGLGDSVALVVPSTADFMTIPVSEARPQGVSLNDPP